MRRNNLSVPLIKTTAWAILLMLPPSAYAQHRTQDDDSGGLIRGVVIGQDGQPAHGIGLVLWPLGASLGVMLPHAETNEAGEYRFEAICPGRYTVLPDDEKAGFRQSTPYLFKFLYGRPVAEVKLTVKHPQGVLFEVDLPRKPGVIQLHITNREDCKS